MTTELTKAAQQALEPCPLTWAIQRINSTPYSLTKDECVEVLRGLRDEIRAITQRPAAQTDEQTVVEICERIGFGRVQQIAGHAWEQKHHCAPRGRMGVTVRNETPAPQQATTEPVGEPFGWVCRYLCHADDDCEQRWTDWHFTLSSESVPPKWSRGSYAAQEAVPVFTHPAPGAPAHPITNSPERQP